MKLNKKFIFIFLSGTCLFIQTLCAQSFNKDENSFSAGYGFGTIIKPFFFDSETYSESSSSLNGPFYIKYESAISENIGLGINLAYAQYNLVYDSYFYSSPPSYQTNLVYTTFSILARMNIHFGDFKKFDPYWGFGVGYRNGSVKSTSNNPNGLTQMPISINFPFGFETTLGVRFYATDNFGLYLETGLAKSVMQVGLTIKL